jgi:hypothetical protein
MAKFIETGEPAHPVSLNKRAAMRSFKNALTERLFTMKVTEAFSEDELTVIYNNFRAKYPNYEDFKNAPYLELCSVGLMRYTMKYDLQTNMDNLLNMVKKLDTMSYDDIEHNMQPILNFTKQESLF